MSGNSAKPQRLLWDSCVFLAWLKEESDKPLVDIEAYIRDVERGKLQMQVSVISFAEVLDIAVAEEPLAATAGTRFRQWVKRSTVDILNVDPRIADRAGQLKERFRELKPGLPKIKGKDWKLKIPDALIVATAIEYRVGIIHTFDPDMLDLAPYGVFGNVRVERPEYVGSPMPPDYRSLAFGAD